MHLPGVWLTSMGFSGPVRPWRGCCGSVAVHRSGPPCPSMRGGRTRGLAGYSPTRTFCSNPDRGLRGPHPCRGIGNFHSQSPRLWSSPPPLSCDCFFAALRSPRPPALRRGGSAADAALSWGCSKIAPPSVPVPESPFRCEQPALARRLLTYGAGLP